MLKELLNGYQCEICKTIYNQKKKAIECESQISEEPIKEIGFEFKARYYYGEGDFDYVDIPTRIYKISFSNHKINYELEQNLDGKFQSIIICYGNKDLLRLINSTKE